VMGASRLHPSSTLGKACRQSSSGRTHLLLSDAAEGPEEEGRLREREARPGGGQGQAHPCHRLLPRLLRNISIT